MSDLTIFPMGIALLKLKATINMIASANTCPLYLIIKFFPVLSTIQVKIFSQSKVREMIKNENKKKMSKGNRENFNVRSELLVRHSS